MFATIRQIPTSPDSMVVWSCLLIASTLLLISL